MGDRGRLWALCALLGSGLPGACKPAPVSERAAMPGQARPVVQPSLERRVCDDEGPCSIRRRRAAGTDDEGRPLTVLTVDRGPAEASGSAVAAMELDDGLVEDERGDSFTPPVGQGCLRIEYWLVVGEPAAPASVTRLLALCNDGNGAAGLGEDRVEVGANRLTHTSVGGSSWRWDSERIAVLSPLRVRSVVSHGYLSAGANSEERRWRWDEFAGEVRWYSPPCDEAGATIDEGETHAEFAYAAIPEVELEPRFVAGGWQQAALGRCALALDATGARGHVIHGSPGEAADSSLRVVAAAHGQGGLELYVEVTDDRWVGPGPRWLRDDHLELWLADELPTYMEHCLDRDVPPPRQWAVGIADGKVHAGHGAPDPAAIAVERIDAGPGVVRLRLRLHERPGALTVVYSDSDDGKAQERRIASSALVFGRAASLGALTRIEPDTARCRLVNGRLEPVLLAYEGPGPLL